MIVKKSWLVLKDYLHRRKTSLVFLLFMMTLGIGFWCLLLVYEQRRRIEVCITKVEKNCFSDTIQYAQMCLRFQKMRILKEEYMHNAVVKEKK
jgi:hypothetical protein